MDLGNNNLNELKKLEAKVFNYEESLSSIHRIFVYAASLVFKNLPLAFLFIFFSLLISYINSLMFSDFHNAIKNFDITDLNNLELESAALSSLLISAVIHSIPLKILSYLVIFGFASYICVKNNEDNHLPTDLASIFNLLFSSIITLLFAIIIKYSVIFIGFMVLIPGIWFMLQLLFVQYIVIFEKKGLWYALSKSSDLMIGVKGSFLFFISYAPIVFLPVWIFDFYSGGFSSVILNGSEQTSINNLLLALLAEGMRSYIWLSYSVGICLLYLKRAALFEEKA